MFAKNPKGGKEVVEKGAGRHGHSVQDGSFDRSVRLNEKKEEVEEGNLNKKCGEGRQIILTGLPPVGWPSAKRPCGIEQIVDSATDAPSGHGRQGGCQVSSGIDFMDSACQGEEE